ncbi:MAG: hypothetical protein ACMUHY_09720 [Thermoplasmatota archaeon]
MRRKDKDDLRSRLRDVISDIPLTQVDDRVKVHLDLKRITSLEITGASTGTAHKKKPSIDEIMAEMEAEIERLR